MKNTSLLLLAVYCLACSSKQDYNYAATRTESFDIIIYDTKISDSYFCIKLALIS